MARGRLRLRQPSVRLHRRRQSCSCIDCASTGLPRQGTGLRRWQRRRSTRHVLTVLRWVGRLVLMLRRALRRPVLGPCCRRPVLMLMLVLHRLVLMPMVLLLHPWLVQRVSMLLPVSPNPTSTCCRNRYQWR